MDRTPFDTLGKAGLRVLLTPRGKLEVPIAIAVAPKEGDGFFAPDSDFASSSLVLGLLGELLTTPTLIEAFSTPLREEQLEECILKLHGLRDQQAHEAKAGEAQYTRAQWPWLLLFVPSATDDILERFVVGSIGERERVANMSPGVCTLIKSDRLRLVVVDRVPPTPHTHLVRLLFGRDKVLENAWATLDALNLPSDEKRRLLRTLENNRKHLVRVGALSPEEDFMQFMPGTDIPDYWQEDLDRATEPLRAQLAAIEAELHALEQQRAEEERMRVVQEQERMRVVQEQARALAIALMNRFPGINGEQAVLERYLSTLPLSEALSQVLTWTLPQLMEAAAREG